MGIQQNMADTIRMIMELRHKTLEEFADDLEISRSTLHEYIKARGNPTALMIEHLEIGRASCRERVSVKV